MTKKRRGTSPRRSVGKAVVGAGVAAGIAIGGTGGNSAFAHTRDTGFVRVVSLPSSAGCVSIRAELKHEANDMRVWGKVRSYAGAQNASGIYYCSNSGTALMLRLKLQAIRRPAGGTYSLCLSTVGDGRGESGYIHTEGTGWEMGRAMTYQGDEYFRFPCGNGSYRAKTWGHAYNDTWRGGSTDTPTQSFPTK